MKFFRWLPPHSSIDGEALPARGNIEAGIWLIVWLIVRGSIAASRRVKAGSGIHAGAVIFGIPPQRVVPSAVNGPGALSLLEKQLRRCGYDLF